MYDTTSFGRWGCHIHDMLWETHMQWLQLQTTVKFCKERSTNRRDKMRLLLLASYEAVSQATNQIFEEINEE